MADLLRDFKTYFIASGLTTEETCWLDALPDEPDSSMAVYEYQGHPGLPQIDSASRSIQIVVRDKVGITAKVKSQALFNSLMTEDGILNLTPERWCMIAMRQLPFKFKIDDVDRSYYSFNMGVQTYTD